jgi:hypothetical protein
MVLDLEKELSLIPRGIEKYPHDKPEVVEKSLSGQAQRMRAL